MKRGILAAILIAIAVRLLADAPLPPPSKITRCSPSGRFCAMSDPKLNAVIGYRSGEIDKELWRVEGWQRSFDLADDGDHLVVCYSGVNLLPLDYKPDWVMLKFYNRGALIRQWTLRELVPDLGKLRRTVSHYEWGHCAGFQGDGSYKVETVDRGGLGFDPASGRLER